MMRFGWAALLTTGAMLSTTAAAAPGQVMKACGAKYQAAKTGKTLATGETWRHFLATCRAGMPRAAVVADAKPSSGGSGAQVAARDRMKQCSGQWKADKAAGKTGDQRWPAYWSACSARLKAS